MVTGLLIMRNLLVSVWKSKASNDSGEKSSCLWRRYVLGKCWHFVSFDTNLLAASGYTPLDLCVGLGSYSFQSTLWRII